MHLTYVNVNNLSLKMAKINNTDFWWSWTVNRKSCAQQLTAWAVVVEVLSAAAHEKRHFLVSSILASNGPFAAEQSRGTKIAILESKWRTGAC